MDSFRTEEEQVEALRRWWDENGKSTVVAVAVALALGFGYQGFKANQQQQSEQASNLYQAMVRAVSAAPSAGLQTEGMDLAQQLKDEYSGSTYAQFAALHLAAIAVREGDLMGAESQLRWVLGKAAAGSDTAQVARLRLARVMASNDAVDQALAILDEGGDDYRASYAVARGDILMLAGRTEEARDAYTLALAESGAAGANLSALRQKLQALTPVVPTAAATVDAALPETAEPQPEAGEQPDA